MFSFFARFLLVMTSLSPVLGAVAVNKISRGEPLLSWMGWLISAMGLVAVCALLLGYAVRNMDVQISRFVAFEKDGKESLAFLVAYLLPLFASEKLGFSGDWMTGAYIFAVIFLVVAHSGNLSFNPVMGMLGYKFYSVQTKEGVREWLISKDDLRRPNQELETVEISPGIKLHRRSGK